MPRTAIWFFRDADGAVSVLEWLETLPAKARAKCEARIGRLRELGHDLRRPEADYLRDGIRELRASHQGVHYRILYFFHGKNEVVLAHGRAKEREVPSREIDRAVHRMIRFSGDPAKHGHRRIQT